jgi:hypothetical protein
MNPHVVLAVMITSTLACVAGAFLCWHVRAPEWPASIDQIQPGMTIGEIEHLLGQRLREDHSNCEAPLISYILDIDDPTCGQQRCLVLRINPAVLVPKHGPPRPVPRDAQKLYDVLRWQWSRIAWLDDWR